MPKHYGPLLRLLHSAIDRELSAALEQLELTSAQGHILGYLARQEDRVYARDLEEVFHLSHPTVSGLLSRLEKKGFIAMHTDDRDRRCKQIVMLPKGKETVSNLYRVILSSEAKLVEGFSPEEQTQFRELLIRAISNIGGWPDRPPIHSDSKEEPK